MDYFVMRYFAGGKLMSKHMAWASRARGTLSIRQENDTVRGRTTLVARFNQWPDPGKPKEVPPLYDAVLVRSTGELWTIAGYELVMSGTLREHHFFAQSWQIEPAQIDDVIRLESEWGAAARKVAELEAKLKELESKSMV